MWFRNWKKKVENLKINLISSSSQSVTNRNAPTTTPTTAANLPSVNSYQWPPSPILPPISSRTPHLIPETLMPTNNLNNYTSHDKSDSGGGACSF